jgi:hypothetical protein
VRLNEALIPCREPGSPAGATYTWRDDAVSLDTTYYYRLEAVTIGGDAVFHGPVQATVAEIGAYLPLLVR